MRESRPVIGSRVGRRLLVSFLIASLVPILVTVALTVTEVSGTLEERAYTQLEDAGRSIGQQLLDRLLIADRALGYIGAADRRDGFAIAAAQLVQGDEVELVHGEPFRLPDLGSLDPVRPTLLVRDGGGVHELLIARSTERGVLVGRIDTAYLWEAANLLPFATNLCVIDSRSRSFLLCTEGMTADGQRVALATSAEHSAGRLEWGSGRAQTIGTHWELFLPSRFATTPWTIVVSQPADVALSSLNAFNQVFPPVIVTSLILIVLLSLSQIRRILTPLQQLLAGTRDIAERRFQARVELDSRDEFAEVGAAMNAMAESLGAQFATITALAEIDRLILSLQPIEKVVEQALNRLAAIAPTWCISVLLLDPDESHHGHLYSRVLDGFAGLPLCRVAVTERARGWLASVSAGAIATPDSIRSHVRELPTLSACTSALAVPIFRGDDLRGAFIAQIGGAEAVSGDERARFMEFASRLAVAIAAADHEKELFDRAHFDALTGLPNRQLCYDRLHQAIAQARREQHRLAVLFIDLDNFKTVNDSLGHSLGDELLRETALRLISCVRDTDTVARLGGDEYVVVLPHVHGLIEVEVIVQKILSLLRKPFTIDGRESIVSASIGVTLYPDDGQSAEELLRKADTAMYAAKSDGRGRSVAFRAEMDRLVQERFALQEDLRHALHRGEFSLVYQPEFDLGSGDLLCVETLLRWRHPERGLVPPGTFVPVLEDMGLIEEVGRWTIGAALAEYAEWRGRGLRLPRISINVSGRQLLDGGFFDFVVATIRDRGLQEHNVELELTEHSLVADFADANDVLSRFGARGIRVAIDDFGTGYSSLGYLQGLHFDVLKIDRAFVAGLPASKSVAIVQAIVAVARALGKEVVAEGIETQVQHSKLVELGCDIGQGYLFSLPVNGEDLVAWMRHAAGSTTGPPAGTRAEAL